MSRADGRRPDQLRPLDADPRFLDAPHGMVLWSQGRTRVLCTASLSDGVPRWLYRSGRGWLPGLLLGLLSGLLRKGNSGDSEKN